MKIDFSATVTMIRRRLEGATLHPAELRDLLDQLREVEDTLPPEPSKPAYAPLPDLSATTGLTRRQRIALKHELRTRREDQGRLDIRWQSANKAWQKKYAMRARILGNLRTDICLALEGRRIGLNPESLPWSLLPPSELSEARVIAELGAYQARRPDLRVDESRLREAYRLGPQRVFVGREGFDGYFAFVFDSDRSVLLDHPIVGNAAFLFGAEWQVLSRLSKRDLSAFQQGRFVRIVHNTGWQSRLRRVLSGTATRSLNASS